VYSHGDMKIITKPLIRDIADSLTIRNASVTLDFLGSEEWGQWRVTTSFLQHTGGGNWLDCISRDEFFSRDDAICHAKDEVKWLTTRQPTLKNY